MKLLFFAAAARNPQMIKLIVGRTAHRVLAVVMMALLLWPAASINVSAATPPSDPLSQTDYFLLYQDQNGEVACREASASEIGDLKAINPKNLRQINHTEDKVTGVTALGENAVNHLTINLLATANLEANAAAKAAFIRAAAAWENVITSPVTIFVEVDYGPTNFGTAWPSGVLGSTSSPSLGSVSYSVVRNNLINGANTPAKQSVYNALPASSVPTDLGNASSVSVSSSIARAIGLLNPVAQETDNKARIGFNSEIVNYDFDPSNGIVGTDFEAVATHELGHALGFTSRSGSGSTTPAIWDLYRFRSGTTSATFPTAQRIMTVGGPTLNSQFYFVPVAGQTELGLSDGGPSGSSDNNADGNQSSHWRQASKNGGVFIGIMDPRIPSGTRRQITTADVNAIDIFGFNSNAVAPPPPPGNDNFAAGQLVSGCSGSVSGANIGATREAGEPIHSPDGVSSSRSVWYHYFAPASGNTTLTTKGSNFDTVLGVYDGTAVNALTALGKDDDSGGSDRTSVVNFAAVAGHTYRIAVDGYNNGGAGGDFGSITLNWNASGCTNSVNLIDDPNFFVQQHYVDFLNRQADSAGLNFWVNEINSCGANAACIELKRINVSAAFFLSIEFQETGYLVYRIYKSSLGNLPGAPVPITLSDFLRDAQQIGQGVQVNVGNWQAQLEANKQAFTLAFVQRSDFLAAFPNSMSATDFVTQLNTRAGGVLSASEQSSLINLLGATPSDVTKRSQVLRAVAEDTDLKNAEFNRAFVLMQYFGYLRRNPNASPDSNFDGYNFWLAKLNQFNGDFVAAEMVKAFITSVEYRRRFGP